VRKRKHGDLGKSTLAAFMHDLKQEIDEKRLTN